VVLAGVHFLQYSEYWVLCVNVCVIHLQVIFADLVFFHVLKCFHFLCILIMPIVSIMVPYLCPVFNTWFE
jgi:hypothetical protein